MYCIVILPHNLFDLGHNKLCRVLNGTCKNASEVFEYNLVENCVKLENCFILLFSVMVSRGDVPKNRPSQAN